MSLGGWRVAACGVLMATWWVTEAIPIPATALVPLLAFPLLGVGSIDDTAAPYANPVIYLFMGGFMIAGALQASGLHRRIALAIIGVVGTKPVNLVGGFMIATALISMWVSNTATVVMMLPMVLSVIALTEGEPDHDFDVALLLGVAYAASIGGLGTIVGTPPNALLVGFLDETYGIEIGFGEWMLVGVPLVIVSLPLTWLLLVRLHPPKAKDLGAGREMIRRERQSLGRVSHRERIVGTITVAVALAWVTRPFLEDLIPGLSDAGIAVAGAVLLFFVPVRWRPLEFGLAWRDADKLPWSILLLFGGGLSLADAIQRTGLAAWIGEAISRFEALPIVLLTLIVTTVVIFLTELTSNTATAATFLPVVASLAVGMGHAPMVLAVPAALAASCAFMMPVATPPNAIVYGSGRVAIVEMVRAGIWLNLLMIVLIEIAVFTLAIPLLGSAN